MSYTPGQYHDLYRSMTVPLANGLAATPVDVHEYRNAQHYDWDGGGNKDGAEVGDHDVVAGMDEAWKALRQKIARHGKKRTPGVYRVTVPVPPPAPAGTPPAPAPEEVSTKELSSCFFGKGSPEAIQKALRLAHAFGLVGGTAAEMNDYCTKYIGLDCSGFVGNYLKACGSSDYGPSTRSTAFAPVGTRLSSLEQIQACDVFCWTGTNHVAIIDEVDHMDRDDQGRVTGVVAWVCESCGGQTVKGDVHTDGLHRTQYAILKVNTHQVFSVSRAGGWEKARGWSKKLERMKHQMHVHIGRLL